MKKRYMDSRNRFLPLFLAGFAMGILYILIFGKNVARETSLMSRYFFSKYQQIEFASDELFWYIWRSRWSVTAVLWLTGLTVLGTAAVYIFLFWIGMALGVTVTTAAVKLGFMGVLLCVASGLPQFVLYIPAGCWFLKKVQEMSVGQEGGRAWHNGKSQTRFYALVGLVACLLTLLGVFLEAYVNPMFLKTLLSSKAFS